MQIQSYAYQGANAYSLLGQSTLNTRQSSSFASKEASAATQGFVQDIVNRIDKEAAAAARAKAEEERQAELDAEASALTDPLVEETSVETTKTTTETTAETTGSTDATDAGEDQDSAELAASLEKAINHIRENYGDAAATAAMGVVYQKIGDKPVTEKSLGDGLADAITLVNKNFGNEAGDEVVSFFNADVNNELNEYFENGQEEEFYSAPIEEGASAETELSEASDGLSVSVGEALTAQPEVASRSSLQDVLEQSLDTAELAETQEESATQPWSALPYESAAALSAPTVESLGAGINLFV